MYVMVLSCQRELYTRSIRIPHRTTLRNVITPYSLPQDIRPSPNPTQELQRAMSSLPRDDWPEIFHTLNSVRRLAAHHAPLLSSQPHLHALVRDVLALVENLRSQARVHGRDRARGGGNGNTCWFVPEPLILCASKRGTFSLKDASS